LHRLGERPGANQSELAELLEVEKVGAGRLSDKLEEKGLAGAAVTCDRSPYQSDLSDESWEKKSRQD